MIANPLEAPVFRQPERPAWAVDVTDFLALVEAEPDAKIEEVMAASTLSHAEALSRENQKNFRPEPAKRFWWKAQVRIPEGITVDRPLVIEVDEIRLVTGMWLDGKPLRLPQKPSGEVWSGGEGTVVLPVVGGFSEGLLCL